MLTILFLILMAIFKSAAAEILRVPGDFATIQGALSASASGDTVIVSPGVFVESVTVPARNLMIVGEIGQDSIENERAVIDPTDLPGSDTLGCLVLTGGTIEIRNMVFRNRSPMRENRQDSRTGGVQGSSNVVSATFTDCTFDSTFVGIRGLRRTVLNECNFVGCFERCVSTHIQGRLYAFDTDFECLTGNIVLWVRGGGRLEDCRVMSSARGSLLTGLGDSLSVLRCEFFASDSLDGSALTIRPRCNSEVRDCLFSGLSVGGSVVEVVDTCFGQHKENACAIELSGNRFIDCGSGSSDLGGGEMLRVHCAAGGNGFLARIDSTIVDSTRRIAGDATGFLLQAGCEVLHNRFRPTLLGNRPQVYVSCDTGVDTIFLRGNDFVHSLPGVMHVENEESRIDARNNWWGDATGPYHFDRNPNGQGAEVGDNVLFAPWSLLPHDTTADSNSVSFDSPSPFRPESCTLSAYPTPFNAVTTLVITVARAGEYEVKLFDVMGRESTVLYDGYLSGQTQVSVNANWLPSGVYFAVLSRATETLAVTKLLLLK